jgi:rhombotail lipoprotein
MMTCWRALTVALAALSLSGCAAIGLPWCAPQCDTVHHNSSSLVEFLYPNQQLPPRDDTIPELHVPLRVGLAFLPAHGDGNYGGPDAAQREELLERIKQRFRTRKFVSDIVVIPDYYLGSQRGFAALEQVQRLYGVDVLALVSYDQVRHTDENGWSMGYLTIVGAFVIKGDRYDISTLVDLAVVDAASRALILRAGGVDTRHGTVTLVDYPREAREAAAAAFSGAADHMIEHFDGALSAFEDEVRAGRANVHVVHHGGGGAMTWPWLVALAALLVLRAGRRAVPGAVGIVAGLETETGRGPALAARLEHDADAAGHLHQQDPPRGDAGAHRLHRRLLLALYRGAGHQLH